MTGIALCAISLAILREAPAITLLLGPLIGSLLEVRKGGRGWIGGLLGGAVTWGGSGLFGLIASYSKYPTLDPTPADPAFLILLLPFMTLGGAVYGTAVGLTVCYLRYLATLPRSLRLRTERSARANFRRNPGAVVARQADEALVRPEGSEAEARPPGCTGRDCQDVGRGLGVRGVGPEHEAPQAPKLVGRRGGDAQGPGLGKRRGQDRAS